MKMKLITKYIRNIRGVSFIEIMVALALTGIITTAVLRLYVTQHRNYMVQDDITDIQQNVRSSIDEITRNLRMAGYEIPEAMKAIEASNTNPDTITITFHDDGCDTYLSAAMPQPSAELKCGTELECFYSGQWVYIYEADSAIGEWFMISHVQNDAKHLQHRTMQLTRKYGANALIFGIVRVKYFIDNTTDPEHPRLMRQLFGQTPQVFAENISDLQFKYVSKSGKIEDEPSLLDNLREVQVSVAGHSNSPEYDDLGQETIRNRSFQTSIFMRNVGN
jgi:hypothetical protein